MLSLSVHQLSAQAEPQAKTLFGKSKIKNVDFFVSPAFGITSMDNATVSLLLLRAGVEIDNKFSVGGFYSLSLNEIRPQSEVIPNIYMDYRVGGGFIEYTAYSNRLIHVGFPLMVGYGEVEMDNDSDTGLNLGEQDFFVVEPGVMAKMNLYKKVQLNLGTSYRLVSNMNYRNLNQSDISGLVGYLGVKLKIP